MLSVAGMRWKIEDCNGETKDLLGSSDSTSIR
jgi:hypothetical protein